MRVGAVGIIFDEGAVLMVRPRRSAVDLLAGWPQPLRG
jgi:hypothetical protein